MTKRKGYFLTIYDDGGPMPEGFHGTDKAKLTEAALMSLGYSLQFTSEPVLEVEYLIVGKMARPKPAGSRRERGESVITGRVANGFALTTKGEIL